VSNAGGGVLGGLYGFPRGQTVADLGLISGSRRIAEVEFVALSMPLGITLSAPTRFIALYLNLDNKQARSARNL
jgi:hypothetical protein